VDFETSLFAAQLNVLGVGRLDSDGARGGPEALAAMQKTVGRFDLFDAWAGDDNPRRAQIARGQTLFNDVNRGGRSCNACHNTANNGTNINDVLFDIETASASARTADLPLYTFQNPGNGEPRLTDAGMETSRRLGRPGPIQDADAARPSARGLLHNGIAATEGSSATMRSSSVSSYGRGAKRPGSVPERALTRRQRSACVLRTIIWVACGPVATSMADIVLVLTTVPDSDQGEVIARTLVEERLAACVNVLPPMASIYRWRGGVERESERQLIIKTTRQRVEGLRARLTALHPYELPEFIVLAVADGGAAYLQWIEESCN
jgi:periplasmic divalent cation tolerance protein